MLDLPFSARRLFDDKGVERSNLAGLTRDQLVFVTCGEPWSNPTLSKSEQQRHFLLANIAADLAQMKHFVQLRNADSQLLTYLLAHEIGYYAHRPTVGGHKAVLRSVRLSVRLFHFLFMSHLLNGGMCASLL